jgi:hypothetical protein
MSLLGAVLVAGAAAAAPCSTAYFPLTLGSEWEYRLETDVGPPVGRTMGCTTIQVIRAAATSVSLSHAHRQGDAAEPSTTEFEYICTAEGPVGARDWVRFGAVTGSGSETPRELAPGLRWSSWLEMAGPRRAVIKTDHHAQAVETVTVPAGTYEALRVDFERLDADQPEYGLRLVSRGSRWYAKDVGLVRYRAETTTTIRGTVQGRATVTQELVRVHVTAER